MNHVYNQLKHRVDKFDNIKENKFLSAIALLNDIETYIELFKDNADGTGKLLIDLRIYFINMIETEYFEGYAWHNI
jgi:hypothetical protein